jgi:Zn-dependent M28 family amino/carboxypeptidase
MSVPDMLRGMSAGTDALEPPDSMRTLPMVLLGRLDKNQALLPTRWPADDRAQLLSSRRFTGKAEQKSVAVTSYNVVGIVPGIDPALRTTYVAYGAHYDHLGVLAPVNGDSIANGADDDGSGSMALLAIAKAFASQPRPRRSVLFVWHTGEEKGLLGSEYFTSHPTVSIKSIVAQINADMIGRNNGDSVFIVGPNAAPDNQSRVLGWIADSVNAREPRPLVFDRTFDDPNHPEHIYERSDHFNYARKGIPIVFFTTGLHADYHEVSDEAAKIDYEKMARVEKLMFDVGVAVGSSGRRPR